MKGERGRKRESDRLHPTVLLFPGVYFDNKCWKSDSKNVFPFVCECRAAWMIF